jgi:hypothetical protein
VYEFRDGRTIQSWNTRMPIPNTYFLEIGHFTDPDKKSFIVGGFDTSALENRTLWYFELFEARGGADLFESISNISFTSVRRGENSIFAVDLDGDGRDEIILGLSPHLYVLRYIEGQGLVPIFWTYSDTSYQIGGLPADKNNQHDAFVVFNKTEQDGLKSYLLTTIPDSNKRPQTPRNLRVSYLEDNHIRLAWDSSDAQFFNIYSMSCLGEESVNQSVSPYFYDQFYNENHISYQVTAVNTSFPLSESLKSSSLTAVNEPLPAVKSLRKIGDRELVLTFDRRINRTSTNMMHYSINHGIGFPSSVNFMDEYQTIYLVFFEPLPIVDDLHLSFTGLMDEMGRNIPDMSIRIDQEVDIDPPMVLRNYLAQNNQINIHFSKKLSIESVSDISDFILEPPIRDRFNRVTNATLRDSTIIITLHTDALITVDNYYLTMRNIRDLSGNLLPNNQTRIILNLTEINDLNFLEVFPNPININKNEAVTFGNLPEAKDGELKIFNISGELVFQQEIKGQRKFYWNATNNSGRNVSSGLYHYIITMGDENKRGQIVVVR